MQEELESKRDSCLRNNDLAGARENSGKIELLKMLFSEKSDLLNRWVEEIKEGKPMEDFGS
jgi:hypothetical protein